MTAKTSIIQLIVVDIISASLVLVIAVIDRVFGVVCPEHSLSDQYNNRNHTQRL